MRVRFPVFLIGLLLCVRALAGPAVVEHGVVYKETDRFAGWPANNGIWAWGDEIVVGFTLGWHDDASTGGHPIDRDRASSSQQARSLDGGRTWTTERPTFLDESGRERDASDCPGDIDFRQPDFAFRLRGGNFYHSSDRARTWHGPFRLPDFGRPGLLARTDYIIEGKHDLFAFLATEKDDGKEGWPVCTRTQDGGRTWARVGWIGPQPGPGEYAIMPSTLRLKNGAFLSMIRRRGVSGGKKSWWVEPYLSPDNGSSWYLLDAPLVPNAGNPAHMIRLRDGRIVLTYGWRAEGKGVRARLSSDEGLTWGEEIVLRGDGNTWDLGYPRTVQRADGKILTAYYFNDSSSKERYIATTLWDPGE